MFTLNDLAREKWMDNPENIVNCAMCKDSFEIKTKAPRRCPKCGTTRWRTGKAWPDLDNIKETIMSVDDLVEKDSYVRVAKPTHIKIINQIVKLHRLVKNSIVVKYQARDDVYIYFSQDGVVAIMVNGEGRVFVDV